MRRVLGLKRAVWLLVFAVCLGIPAWSAAQTTPPGPSAAEGSSREKDAAPTPWDRLVYLPFRNLKQALGGDQGTALVPLARYLELWDRIQQLDPPQKRGAPVDAVLTQARYKGTVLKDQASLTAELTVRVLSPQGGMLPLRYGEAALGKLTADDPQIVLHAVGEGGYQLLFPKPGEHTVQLEFTVRVRTSPDGRSVEFECPPAVISSLELSVPGGDQTVELTPAAATSETAVNGDTTQWKGSLGATRKVSARWRPKLGTAPAMEVLATVRNQLDLRIADDLIHGHALLTYQILRGALDRIQLVVPAGQRVLDVATAGLKSWKVADSPAGQVITVELLGAESKTVGVEVFTEAPLPKEGFDLAGLTAAGVAHGIHALGEFRESGIVVVSGTADLALSVEQQQGVVRIETQEIPESLRRSDVLAWRYFSPRMELRIAARPVEPRLESSRSTRLVFRDDEIESFEVFDIGIERAGVFELRFDLPSGFAVDRVECEAMKEHQTPEGTGELILTLREKTSGAVRATVSGRIPYDRTQATPVTLPLLTPAQVVRDRGDLLVYAPESLEVLADEKSVEGVLPLRPRGAVAIPGMRLSAGWSFTVRPEILVRTERRLPRLTAAVATAVHVRQDVVEVDSRIDYLVQFAGVETFRFAVPEGVAGSVQVQPADATTPAIQQQAREGEAQNGWVPWRVVLQREAIGPVRLRVRYDLKPERKGPQKQTTFAVSPLRVLESSPSTTRAVATIPTSVEGQFAVRRERSLSVAATAGSPLESIDVRELTLLPAEGDLAYRYFSQPASLETPMDVDVSASQLEIQEVVESVVARGAFEAVVTEDSKVTCRARYLLKSSERQRLSIDLPRDAVPLDAIVAGKRVELERHLVESTDRRWDAYRISVARSTPADEPFVIALVFQAPYNPRPLPGRGGNLQLNLPRLGGEGGAGSLVVQELRAAVWIPREYAIVGKPADFTPLSSTWISLVRGAIGYTEETTALDRWFGDSSGGLFAFQTSGRAYQYSRLGEAAHLVVPYWRVEFFTWCISGALFCAGVLLTRTSWNNRLSVLLLGAFGLTLAALQDQELVLHILAAGRFGLLAALAWWCIQTLTRPAPPRPVYKPGDPSAAVSFLAAVIPPPADLPKPVPPKPAPAAPN